MGKRLPGLTHMSLVSDEAAGQYTVHVLQISG